jgi:Fe-S cluster biogenesis protein NfuA
VHSPQPSNASAVVLIEHFDVRGTTVIVNPTCMSPIVELLQDVNRSDLSPAQLLIQLYPHIVTRYVSRVVAPTIDIVSFSWIEQQKYFARFTSCSSSTIVRPISHVSNLVLSDPYNTVDILSRFLSRHSGANAVVRAQLPPIYDGTCAVCLSSTVSLSDMLQYDCRHVFCRECAHNVLAMTRSNACPLCRQITTFVREPMRGDDDLIETVDFSDAIEQMRRHPHDAILSDVPAILAAFTGVATSVPRDFAGKTVLFCGQPRLLEHALKMRNTFREGEMKVHRFEIKDGFDEFSRTYVCSVVNDQMLMFWMQRHHVQHAKEVQAWIDRFGKMSDLRAWQGPGFFVHPRVLYNPNTHRMQLGGNGYVSVAKMTELFDAMGMYQDACAEISESSDMDLDDDDAL